MESTMKLWPFSMDENTSGITILQSTAVMEEHGMYSSQYRADLPDESLNLDKFCEFIGSRANFEQEEESEQLDGSSACKVAPLFTGQVLANVHGYDSKTSSPTPTLPQYALLGVLSDALDRSTSSTDLQRNLIFANTNEPWSAFICGSQGSGKSHTLSCLLENALLANSAAGVPQKPAAGIIFHYDKFSGLSSGQICEAAYLCTSQDIDVKVLVAPTSEKRLRKQYRNMPGVSHDSRKPRVIPFYFKQEQLSVDIIMTLMAVQDTGINAPLYMNVIRQMLRELQMENDGEAGFNYDVFVNRLAQTTFTEHASAPLELRLQLLRSVLLADKQTLKTMALYEDIWNPQPGSLTIVDLSDAFINENDACALFSICMKLFMTGWQNAPRIIALDEAHKFLTITAEAQKLTSDLIAVVRQQRHFNSRVIVATQEPTVSGEFLDLCNVSIVHRFNSPHWFNTIKSHLAAAHNDGHLFDAIVKLKPGQAILFCPTAVINADPHLSDVIMSQNRHLKVSIRKRVSADGGRSITAAQNQTSSCFEDENVDAVDVKRMSSATLREVATRAKDKERLTSLASVAPVTSHAADSSSSTLVNDSADSSSDSEISIQGGTSTRGAISGTVQSTTSPSAKKSKEKSKKLTKVDIENLMYEKVKNVMSKPIKDPSGSLYEIVRKIEEDVNMPERSIWEAKFPDGANNVSAKLLMRRAIKRHYDTIGVPASGRRKDIKWLN